MHVQDEEADGGCCQKGHEVVPNAEGEHERHQDEKVVILPLAEVLLPTEDQPREQRDSQQRDGVDLLIHIGLIPDCECGGAYQNRGGCSRDAKKLIAREVP